MGIAFAIFGVAFAALCVWLIVRVINRRERWAKWALVLWAGLPFLYVLSFGPACWISSHFLFGNLLVSAVYKPLFHISWSGFDEGAIMWYGRLFSDESWNVIGNGSEFYWMSIKK